MQKHRYSDFVEFHDRVVQAAKSHSPPMELELPALPPKSWSLFGSPTADDAFLEERRKGLENWLIELLKPKGVSAMPVVRMFLLLNDAAEDGKERASS